VSNNFGLTKMATKYIDEMQIWRASVLVRHFLTRRLSYQSDQKGLTETTVHSYG
jgi:hypothetical protein